MSKEKPTDIKRKTIDFLKGLCIIKEGETATIKIGINQGKVLYIEKKAKIL